MFQPQPTPFAAACFNSYGVPDFASFPLTLQTLPGGAGGSTTSTTNSSPNDNHHSPAAGSDAPPPRHNRHQQHRAAPHSHHPQQQQHQHQQQSLLYNASTSVSPVASSHGHFSPASSRNLNSPYNTTPPKMEHEGRGMLQDELAAQEAAAREYQPRLEGPLVGERISSGAISEEYAKADPIYVEKTLALPNVYSHYRQVQGDGNCGWRAIGFSYFETLIQQGDRIKVEAEVARITSLEQALTTVGYDRFLFEDMVEETITLLRDIAARMANPQDAMAVLTQRFNDRETSSAIIYHLRLLAASWLKGDPTSYEPFIPEGLGIRGYCRDVVERVDCEIEQLGIMLLVNVLLKPIGFVLEIAYLDRSPGSQVNVYRFPEEANAQDVPDAPVIYLLFRPDHYDILYRTPVTLQINRATSFTHQHDIEAHRQLESFTSMDYTPLAGMLPGFGYAPGSMSTAGLGGSFVSLSQQQPQWITQAYPDEMPSHPVSRPAEQPQHEPSPVETTTLPSRPAPSPAPVASATVATPVAAGGQNNYPLRFSPQCYKLDTSSFPEPNFTTATFKNSHYNKAHYNNPNFHPEEWTPDEECGGGRRRARRHEV